MIGSIRQYRSKSLRVPIVLIIPCHGDENVKFSGLRTMGKVIFLSSENVTRYNSVKNYADCAPSAKYVIFHRITKHGTRYAHRLRTPASLRQCASASGRDRTNRGAATAATTTRSCSSTCSHIASDDRKRRREARRAAERRRGGG